MPQLLRVALISLALLGTGGSAWAATSTELESALNIPSGILLSFENGDVADGSALQLELTVVEGDTFTFDFNFLTNESPGGGFESINDFAFISISPLFAAVLADTFSPLGASSLDSFARETGIQTYSLSFLQSGKVTVGFGVANVVDEQANSGLTIDNVRLNGTMIENGDFEGGTLNGFVTLGTAAVLAPPGADGNAALISATIPEPSSGLLAVFAIAALSVVRLRRTSK